MLGLRLACCIVVATASTLSYAKREGVGAIEMTDKIITVSGNGHHRTFPCQGRKLEVMGSEHVIVATGVCSQVDISGYKNTVDVEIAPKGQLEVAGADHTVRWKSSAQPVQAITGADHKISQVK